MRKEESQLLVACLEEMREGSLVASLDGPPIDAMIILGIFFKVIIMKLKLYKI